MDPGGSQERHSRSREAAEGIARGPASAQILFRGVQIKYKLQIFELSQVASSPSSDIQHSEQLFSKHLHNAAQSFVPLLRASTHCVNGQVNHPKDALLLFCRHWNTTVQGFILSRTSTSASTRSRYVKHSFAIPVVGPVVQCFFENSSLLVRISWSNIAPILMHPYHARLHHSLHQSMPTAYAFLSPVRPQGAGRPKRHSVPSKTAM
jgi:hypothetical protein